MVKEGILPACKVKTISWFDRDKWRKRGRRCFECPHGKTRPSKSTGIRPNQNVKFTKCHVSININEQDNGSFVVTKAILDHINHPVSKKDFFTHQHAKVLNNDDMEFVKHLKKARANPSNFASCLSARTNRQYTSKDVRNLISRVKN